MILSDDCNSYDVVHKWREMFRYFEYSYLWLAEFGVP